MNRNTLILAATGVVLLVSGLWTLHAQQQATTSPNFTGTIERLKEEKPGQITYIRFDAGARTKWHIHEKGQIVFVEEGVALEQQKGGPVRELHAGDVIYCPPGVAHWHGAAPDKGGTQYNVTRGGITWLDQVTDQEYKATPVRK